MFLITSFTLWRVKVVLQQIWLLCRTLQSYITYFLFGQHGNNNYAVEKYEWCVVSGAKKKCTCGSSAVVTSSVASELVARTGRAGLRGDLTLLSWHVGKSLQLGPRSRRTLWWQHCIRLHAHFLSWNEEEDEQKSELFFRRSHTRTGEREDDCSPENTQEIAWCYSCQHSEFMQMFLSNVFDYIIYPGNVLLLITRASIYSHPIVFSFSWYGQKKHIWCISVDFGAVALQLSKSNNMQRLYW